MRAVLDHTEDIALNIRTFWWKPEQKLDFNAGQYLRWYIPHKGADDRGERRWFTISASPTEVPLISFTTKFTADGGSSFKKNLKELKPGAQAEFTGPLGDFVLPIDKSIPLVFVAGGIGVTPFRSMVKSLLDTGEKRDIKLIYAANKLEEVAFRNIFESFGLDTKIVLSEPPENWQSETGRLDGKRILELAPRSENNLYYLSGPEPMIEAIAKDLEATGLPASQIVTDFFPGYTKF